MATAPAPTAAMVFLDFKKAYDTILRRFLLKVMEAVGAGEGCLKWARTLLTSTSASAAVNGFVSAPVAYMEGVRQGCPLAPILYLFIAWALWCWLQECPAVGVQVTKDVMIHGDQYADDTHALLKSMSAEHVASFLLFMEIFSRASGQHLNRQKTVILPVGATPAGACPHKCRVSQWFRRQLHLGSSSLMTLQTHSRLEGGLNAVSLSSSPCAR